MHKTAGLVLAAMISTTQRIVMSAWLKQAYQASLNMTSYGCVELEHLAICLIALLVS
jgi:hypothetical protein